MSKPQLNFKFIRSITSIIFDEIADIRSYGDSFDSLLNEHFQTPGLPYAVGPNVPPAVPRFNYKSKLGHSSLDISGISCQMQTHFDGEYSSNFELLKEYCSARQSILEKHIKGLGVNIRYIGFQITIQAEIKQDVKKPADLITENFFNQKVLLGTKNKSYDSSFKVTFLEDDRYFVNFHGSNYRGYTFQVPVEPGVNQVRIVAPSFKEMTESDSGIEFTFDCNNRYLFDFVANGEHKDTDFKNTLKLADKYIAKLSKEGLIDV